MDPSHHWYFNIRRDGATGKAGNGKRDGNGNGNGNGKREREFAQKETTAPRSLFTNSSRDDSATALTAILFTN